MANGRTQKSLINSAVAILFCLFTLCLNFFSRKVFLDYLGADILGLNSTATNLLQFLNLAELGVGASITFALYRPLALNNRSAISEILTLQRIIYRRIAYILLIGAGIISIFFPVIFGKMQLPLWYAYASFGVMLFSSLLSYFVNYKQVLLTANQEGYKITLSYQACLLVKLVVQIFLVSSLEYPYVWWLISEFAFSIIASVALNKVVTRSHPYLVKIRKPYAELAESYREITIKTKQLFFHRIAEYIVTQANPIIIYAILSLSAVTYYTNYTFITTGIALVVVSLFKGTGASVGNLIADSDTDHVLSVYGELFCIRFMLAGICAMCMYFLQAPMIAMWIGAEYTLPPVTVALISLSLFLSLSRATNDEFIAGYGLFKDIWAPIAEVIINLSASITLGCLWGLNGIIAGALAAQLSIVLIWKPILLFKDGFKARISRYISLYLRNLAAISCGLAACIMTASVKINPSDSELLNWIINCIIYLIISLLTTFSAGYIFIADFRHFARRIYSYIKPSTS